MRKMLLVLILVGLTVLASCSELFAQYRSYGNRGGNTSSFSSGVGNGGYYSPFGYGGYHDGWGHSLWNQGYGYGYGSGYGYGGYGGYGYAPSYYYASPGYSDYPATTYSQSAYLEPTQIRQSFYNASITGQQTVRMMVLVPVANAQVWFGNTATTQQGVERMFQSPALDPSQNFTYSIKARWTENGQVVNRERLINVQAGQNITVNFRENNGENVLPPLPLSEAIPRE